MEELSIQAYFQMSEARPHPEVHVWGAGHISEVGFQYLAAALHVWVGYRHVAVKAARAHERLIQRLREVCSRHHNHALAWLEPVTSFLSVIDSCNDPGQNSSMQESSNVNAEIG